MQLEKCGCLLTATKKKGFTYYYCTNGKGECEEHKKYLRSEKIENMLADSLSKLNLSSEGLVGRVKLTRYSKEIIVETTLVKKTQKPKNIKITNKYKQQFTINMVFYLYGNGYVNTFYYSIISV